MALARPVARAAIVTPRFAPVRFYAASAGLSKSDIETRIVDVLKTFEKVDPSKVRSLPKIPVRRFFPALHTRGRVKENGACNRSRSLGRCASSEALSDPSKPLILKRSASQRSSGVY